ncbi:class E sortase [Streptomyces sp. CBMA291]|nr:class E sortase [Streptomyces sp. CBMA291]MBD0708341.1 class E sortase [Streptomyces sp. CBMA291]
MTTGSPWFRANDEPGPEPIPQDPHGPRPPAPAPGYGQPPTQGYGPGQEYPPGYAEPTGQGPASGYGEPAYGESGYGEPGYGEPGYGEPSPHPYGQAPAPHPYEETYAGPYTPPYEPPETSEAPEAAVETTALLEAVEPLPGPDQTAGTGPLPGPGRAERRRAAAKGGRAKGRRGAPAPPPPPGAGSPAAPLSRVEARRAARAAKESVGVVASRVVGELFITFGVVMLLFVTYQLWWTNVLAGQETDRAKAQIEDTWAKGEQGGAEPDAFEPGQGFAIMYIPKLDVVVPIAEGTNKTKVLDKGMVGHYGEGGLKTAMPSDKQGNFAVAGHRNTHGEPFRYVNRLKPGDPIVVETRNTYYTYEMASILPQTSPSNVSVIDPVPKASGFTKPGRYITLTTCTPEFTSTYRMIVWGKLVDERPRSKGKPPALVG